MVVLPILGKPSRILLDLNTLTNFEALFKPISFERREKLFRRRDKDSLPYFCSNADCTNNEVWSLVHLQVLYFTTWVLLIGTGFWWLFAYANTPGAAATAVEQRPSESHLEQE